MMVDGRFGVFEGHTLVGGVEFSDDVSAEEYRSELLQESLPEHMRSPAYDPHQLEVREIPEDYDNFQRVLSGLRASHEEDHHAAA